MDDQTRTGRPSGKVGHLGGDKRLAPQEGREEVSQDDSWESAGSEEISRGLQLVANARLSQALGEEAGLTQRQRKRPARRRPGRETRQLTVAPTKTEVELEGFRQVDLEAAIAASLAELEQSKRGPGPGQAGRETTEEAELTRGMNESLASLREQKYGNDPGRSTARSHPGGVQSLGANGGLGNGPQH
jgi:hypothetical protein